MSILIVLRRLRYRTSRYDIDVENPSGVSHGVALAELDGAALQLRPAGIPLVDDGAVHRLRIVLGSAKY